MQEQDGRLNMNLSPNSAYLWMKQDKTPPAIDLNNMNTEQPSVVTSTQASISRAVETRNEITELIKSVQLDRLVPVTNSEGNSVLNYPLQPQLHQQWLDPLGFNKSFTHQAHSSQESVSDDKLFASASTSIGTNKIGALGLMQQEVEGTKQKTTSGIESEKTKTTILQPQETFGLSQDTCTIPIPTCAAVTVKSTVTGVGLSRFDKPALSKPQETSDAVVPLKTDSAKPKSTSDSWAALTKKQTGVGKNVMY